MVKFHLHTFTATALVLSDTNPYSISMCPGHVISGKGKGKVVHGICCKRRINLELRANESLVLLTNETYEYAHTIMEVCTESTTILTVQEKKTGRKEWS